MFTQIVFAQYAGLAIGGRAGSLFNPRRPLSRRAGIPCRPFPIACHAQRSWLANEWPTNDQWHDRRAW